MAYSPGPAKLVSLSPSDVKLGMFVHSFEGHWADRPFWRTRFVLTDREDLERLKASSIDAVVIDVIQSKITSSTAQSPLTQVHRAAVTVQKKLDPGCQSALQAIARSKREIVRLHADIRLGRPIVVARLTPVVAELSVELERNNAALMSLLRLKAPHDYAHLHSVAVCTLMLNAASALRISARERLDLGMAGLLHDVGKATIPVDILGKPGALTDAEVAVMRRHPQGGAALLRSAKDLPAIAIDVCLHHHERIDGTGYPNGIAGDRLSVAAKMGAICDVYDAMTSHRPYRASVSPQRTLREMNDTVGVFDQSLLGIFMNSIGIFPVGTLVKIRDSSLGLVVSDNHIEPTRPTVRTFFSVSGRHRMPCEDFVVGRNNVLSVERPEGWGFQDWPGMVGELLGERSDKAA